MYFVRKYFPNEEDYNGFFERYDKELQNIGMLSVSFTPKQINFTTCLH